MALSTLVTVGRHSAARPSHRSRSLSLSISIVAFADPVTGSEIALNQQQGIPAAAAPTTSFRTRPTSGSGVQPNALGCANLQPVVNRKRTPLDLRTQSHKYVATKLNARIPRRSQARGAGTIAR